jgi:hypothetical protein
MRFLHTMIRYDLGNAFGYLASGVEDIDRTVERSCGKGAKIVA